MDSGSSDDITNINLSLCGHNSAEPNGDKCQCNTLIDLSADRLEAADKVE